MGDRAMRPFWIHQMAEYLIGVALVSQGLQDTEPFVPTVAGALIVVNAAIVSGPLGAFKFIGRAQHKWLDVAVMLLLAVAAVQPWIAVTSAGRALLVVILLPLGFLWFYTDWAVRRRRTERRSQAVTGATGDRVGRFAGRFAGNAYSAAKRRASKPD